MTAPDLTALADKLDELAMKATPGEWYSEGGRLLAQNVDQDDEFYPEPFSIADFDMDTRIDYDTAATANAALSAAMKRALPQITTALREAARLREVVQGLLNAEADFEDAQQSGNPGHRYASYARLKEARELARAALKEESRG